MRILDPLVDPRWDEKLLAHPDATIFHTAAWARVLKDSYGYSCCYLAETDGDRFTFLLPLMDVRSLLTGRRGVSLPFTDYCEPLSPEGCSADDLVANLAELGRRRKWKRFELRGCESILGTFPPCTVILGHTLDLSPMEENLFAGLKDSTRRNIAKAQREGLKITIGSSLDLVSEFYRLNCITRREHGLPPQPYSFFRHLHEQVLARDNGRVILATHEGRAAGGAVYLHFGRRAVYKYGASDKSRLALRPNELIMWEAIRWYRQRGCKQLCFGRTEPEHEGLRRYKMGWGAAERTIPYFMYDIAAGRFVSPINKGRQMAGGIFRRLPISISRAIGTILYRHVA